MKAAKVNVRKTIILTSIIKTYDRTTATNNFEGFIVLVAVVVIVVVAVVVHPRNLTFKFG